jgi:hypothetical protein
MLKGKPFVKTDGFSFLVICSFKIYFLYRLDLENIQLLFSNGITNSDFQTNLTILFLS